jgi:two-component system, cell cycle response regulator
MASPVYEKLKHTQQLPSPTGVALEILRLAGDEKTTLAAFSAVVESDPAIAGRLLKLVNSPFAGVARRVASVSGAVRMLGIRTVKNLALGFSLLGNHREGRCRAFDFDAFWSMSLARAVAARGIAQHVTGFAPEEAFTLGLLSAIGHLALASAFPEPYERVLTTAGPGDVARLTAAERDAFGIDRYALSAEMLADWGLCELFCSVVRDQGASEAAREPADARAVRLSQLLHLAASVARVLIERGDHVDCVDAATMQAADLGIHGQPFHALFDSIAQEWQAAGLIFSVATQDVPPLEQIVAQARNVADQPASEPAAAGSAPRPANSPLRILVVDDDAAALQLLERYLRNAGYDVVTAANGAEALNIDLAVAPQMIITDWMMPELNGLELCRRLRAHPDLGFVYVIVLTAQAERDRVVEALNAGADDYLTKPYGREELLARVRAGQRIVHLQADLATRNREIAQTNTQLSLVNEKLRVMSVTDELTGLANRREALTRLAECWALAGRYGDPLSCMVADLDYFKRLNDTYGHAAGDRALKEIARRLQESVRAGELVCRLGGEEFLILCPRASVHAAQAAAERLRAAVAAAPVDWDGAQLPVTISLGVAERTAAMPSQEHLLKAADDALYAAKAAGRNRVCAAGTTAGASDHSGRTAPGRTEIPVGTAGHSVACTPNLPQHPVRV